MPSAASEFLSSQGFLNAVIWFGGRKEPTIHCVDLVLPAGRLDPRPLNITIDSWHHLRVHARLGGVHLVREEPRIDGPR